MRATPTVIGSPTSSSTRALQPLGDLGGSSCEPLEPADVEERLVDREPLDQRRRVLEELEHGLARLRVRGHPRRDDDRMRAEPPRLPAAHRRLDRRTPSPRSSPRGRRRRRRARAFREASVVALLDRREERVEVGVEDRRAAGIYEHMFAYRARIRLGRARSRGRAASPPGTSSARARRSGPGSARTPRPGGSSPSRRSRRAVLRPRRPGSRPSPDRPGARARRPRRRRTGCSPAPTIVCFVPGGQCTKSHARSGRSSPSTISSGLARHDEEVLLVGLPVVHRHRVAQASGPGG